MLRILCGADVFPRGGLALGYVKFPYSDIDVSVFVAKDTQKCLRVHGRIRSLIPLFAEVNIYRYDEWERLSGFLNWGERQRLDYHGFPIVENHANRQRREVEAVVFFLKMLIANRRQLKSDFELTRRPEKWKTYLQVLGDNIIVPIQSVTEMDERVSGYLRRVLGNNNGNKIVHKVVSGRNYPAWVDPVEWITERLKTRSPLILPEMSDAEQAIFRLGLLWEVCGVYSQIDAIDDTAGIVLHLENMETCLKGLSDSTLEIDAMNTLKDIVIARNGL